MLDGDVTYLPAAFEAPAADRLFAALRTEIAWQDEEIVLFGVRRRVPRQVAWYGDPGASYSYSGVVHEPLPWTATLREIKARAEALAGRRFNSVLLNRYRDGADGMGWHADDEPELGPEPVIASVSFGATRHFRMRHRRRKAEVADFDLAHGSLLLMRGPTQHHWLHAVPKTRRAVGERINLTFRQVHVPSPTGG